MSRIILNFQRLSKKLFNRKLHWKQMRFLLFKPFAPQRIIMEKKITISLFLTLLFLLPLNALSETIFGPTQYIKAKRSTEIFTDTFSASSGPAKIIVQNGAEIVRKNGTSIVNQVSDGSVVLNGQEIFNANDFKQGAYLLEATINVIDQNSITVELVRSLGSIITVRIIQPSCAITATPQSIFLGGSSRLTWNSNDTVSCEIQPEVGIVPITGFIDVPPLETTSYTISCSYSLGISCSSSTEIVVKDPLKINLLDPLDGAIVNKPKTCIVGQLETEATYQEVSVNGNHAQVNGKTFMLTDFDLAQGANTATVKAVDSNGNAASTNISITRIDSPDGWIEMSINNDGGFAPLDTKLTIISHLLATLNWQTAALLDDGPANVVINKISDGEYDLHFAEPGFYTLNYQVSDVSSNVHNVKGYVSVLPAFTMEDWQEMDSNLQQLSDNFNNLLATLDIESARLEIEKQAKASQVFSAANLSSGALSLVYKGIIPIILDLPGPNDPQR